MSKGTQFERWSVISIIIKLKPLHILTHTKGQFGVDISVFTVTLWLSNLKERMNIR